MRVGREPLIRRVQAVNRVRPYTSVAKALYSSSVRPHTSVAYACVVSAAAAARGTMDAVALPVLGILAYSTCHAFLKKKTYMCPMIRRASLVSKAMGNDTIYTTLRFVE